MDIKYKYVLRSGKYFRRQKGAIYETPRKYIGIKDVKTGEEFPHPITAFLDKNYHEESGSINSETAAGSCIVQFLNFVLNKVSDGHDEFTNINGVQDLTVEHGELFLEACVEEKGNKKNTLKQKEMYLSNFYIFLWKNRILTQMPPMIKVTRKVKNKLKTYYIVEFSYKKTDETLLREEVKRKDFVPQKHESNADKKIIRLNYIREFLLFAKKEAPNIAFGIALQIFAGLRGGEVVNLTRSALIPQGKSKYGQEGLVILVRDRQDDLFSRLEDLDDEQVKVPRDQSALIDPTLCMLYEHHFTKYLKNVKNRNHHDALFYNSNGDSMTTSSYAESFRKLKTKYLTALQFTNGRYDDFLDFSRTKWLTHIGRGIFTNMCLDAGFTAKETAVLRGDKSSQSMEDYKDLVSATYNIRQALRMLEPQNYAEIKELNLPSFHKDWKEVEMYARQIDIGSR